MIPENTVNVPQAGKRRCWWLAVLLVFGVVVAYQPVWHAGFNWDDDEFLTANPTVKSVDIKSADGLRQVWFTASSLDYYPMTYTLWWLEWRLWADNPLGYHLVNVFLHAVSAVLLWRVLLRLKIPGAMLAAALFALHPVNVESVAWISEGKNTLAMVFYVVTFLCWLHFEDSGRGRWYGLALASFALALFSKTAVAPLPLVLLGLAWWRRGGVGWEDVRRVVPFFLMAAAMGLVTVWFHHYRAMGLDVVRTDGFWSRLAGAGWAVWFYLDKAVLPLNLAFVYPRWQINARNALSYIPLALWAAALVLCWRRRRRWGTGLFFGLAYFVVMLLPVLGFLSIYFMRYSLVADHWEYFAIIGPIALAAAVIRRPVPAGVLLLTLGALTWQQCGMYASAETLWRATLARNPGSTIARNNLSRQLLLDGRVDEAMKLCESVLAGHPNDVTAHFNLSNALIQKGRLDEAIAHLQKAMELQPASAAIAYNLGQAYLKKGRFDDAVRCLQNAIRLQPNYPEAFCNLGYALLQEGRQTQAIAAYVKALELDPRYALAHNDLGSILLKLGRTDEAMGHFQQAAEIQPGFAEAHYNLAEILLARGRLDDATRQYEKALEFRPDLSDAQFKLGAIYARQGRDAEAITHYESTLKIQPDNARACNNLAWLLATARDPALRNGRRAVELAQRADQLAQGKNPVILGTLAAAYAETGQFGEAVKIIDRALPLAAGDAGLTRSLKQQATLYKGGMKQ